MEKAIGEIPDRPSQGLYDRSAWINPIFHLDFAWQITGERKFGERAASWFVRTAKQYAIWHQAIVFEYPTACSYDWLHSLFSDAERDQEYGLIFGFPNVDTIGKSLTMNTMIVGND